MSTLAVIFDPHFWPHKRNGGPIVKGINRRGALCLAVGRRAVAVANESAAPLIVAGDLIDSAGAIAPQFAFSLRETLGQCRRPVTLMLGNHDMTADGDHSLGIYTQRDDWTNVQVCDEIDWLNYDEACLVPFHRDIRDERMRDVPLLIAHFGVYDDSFPAWCKKAKGAWHVDALFALMKERNIKAVLAGDWHQRRGWVQAGSTVTPWKGHAFTIGDDERLIFQGGALCPTGQDNPGLHGYGTVALWDTDEHYLSWQELPGPRFCTVRSEAEEQAVIVEAQRLGHNLYLRRYYSGERPATPPGLESYEALPVAVERAAVAAKQEAPPADQLQQMVSEWLDQFNDDRDAMEAHVRRYL